MPDEIRSFEEERSRCGSSSEFVDKMCRRCVEKVINYYRMFAHGMTEDHILSSARNLLLKLVHIEVYRWAVERFAGDEDIRAFIEVDSEAVEDMKIEYETYGANNGFRMLGWPLSYAIHELLSGNSMPEYGIVNFLVAKLKGLLNGTT